MIYTLAFSLRVIPQCEYKPLCVEKTLLTFGFNHSFSEVFQLYKIFNKKRLTTNIFKGHKYIINVT